MHCTISSVYSKMLKCLLSVSNVATPCIHFILNEIWKYLRRPLIRVMKTGGFNCKYEIIIFQVHDIKLIMDLITCFIDSTLFQKFSFFFCWNIAMHTYNSIGNQFFTLDLWFILYWIIKFAWKLFPNAILLEEHYGSFSPSFLWQSYEQMKCGVEEVSCIIP